MSPLLVIFLISFFTVGMALSSFSFLKKGGSRESLISECRIILIQDEEKKETDPHMLLVWKEIQKKLDEWLKSINERIESEDVTRLEVRFLEVLRNILEWIKEKVDAKVDAGEKTKPERKKGRGLFRETHQKNQPLTPLG